MNPKFDFQLVEALPDGRVTGRNCGADAPVGTIFSSLRRRDFPPSKPGEDIASPDLVFVCEVSLRLDAVEIYQRQMDLVASGYTAMLSLSGSGFATVAEFVSTASQHTYYSLCS
jgi:hypothetical protein